MPEDFDDEPEKLDKPPSFFPYEEEPGERVPTDMGQPVEVAIEGVFMAENQGNIQRFILLSDGDRKVPILIGAFEAMSISLALEGQTPDRPMTHDLLRTIIERLDGVLDRVVIDDLWNTTFYAKLYIKKNGKEEMEIDCRPSDAIALAVRFEVPIYVSEGILNQADDV